MFDQYFSPFGTEKNHHVHALKKFETAYKSLDSNKAFGIDDVNSNIVLDFFEEHCNTVIMSLLFYIF